MGVCCACAWVLAVHARHFRTAFEVRKTLPAGSVCRTGLAPDAFDKWAPVVHALTPLQDDAVSCGLFVCLFCDLLTQPGLALPRLRTEFTSILSAPLKVCFDSHRPAMVASTNPSGMHKLIALPLSQRGALRLVGYGAGGVRLMVTTADAQRALAFWRAPPP
jgi:hypothetical protein